MSIIVFSSALANNTGVDNIAKRSHEVLTQLQKEGKAGLKKYVIRLHSFDVEESIATREVLSELVSRHTQPSYGVLADCHDHQEEDPEESNDELASVLEMSLCITDELEIEIAEIPNRFDGRRNFKLRSAARKKGAKTWRDNFLRKLYNGGKYNLVKRTTRNQYFISVLVLEMVAPTWIALDHTRQATINGELADRGKEHNRMKRYATHETASDTARRLAISVSVVEEGRKVVDFWAQKKFKRQVEHTKRDIAHRLAISVNVVEEGGKVVDF
jgi:hypothetical protein